MTGSANPVCGHICQFWLQNEDTLLCRMDDAMMLGIPEVRILHGKGTGALKEEIRKYLRAIPLVSSAKDEQEQFGGAGITVVKLDV